MYLSGAWHTIDVRATRRTLATPIGSLDVSRAAGHVLEPLLDIGDVRTDKRIDFVGGARGTGELERLVDAAAPRSPSRCIRSASTT